MSFLDEIVSKLAEEHGIEESTVHERYCAFVYAMGMGARKIQ